MRRLALLGLASVFLAASLAAAADRPLAVGSWAPDFILTDQDGKPLHLSDRLAKRRYVVLRSDLGPEGQGGRLYGVWDDLWRLERRATFLVDNHGVIRYGSVGSVARGGRGVLEALAKLQRAPQ